MEKIRLDTIAKMFRRWWWGLLAAILFWSAPAMAEDVIYANKCAAGFYLSYSGKVSGDSPSTTSQKTVNCFAWRQFMALNWPADGHKVGESGDRSSVQWQTYPAEADLFRRNGAAPAHSERAPLPKSCAARVEAAGLQPEDLTIFYGPAGPGQKPTRVNSTEQAGAADNEAAWVGASNDTNLWYEIRVNPEEANYIIDHRLYDSGAQAAYIAAGHPLVLPKGEEDGPAGAIELKAAWMEVPDPKNPKWNFFKTGDAAIIDAADSDCRLTEVALVGLHVIQKTSRQPTFFWATFEHIDNVPNAEGPVSGDSYNLYNDHCRPRKVAVDDPRCLAGRAIGAASNMVTVGCAPNVRPPYHIGGDCPAPRAIQTTRLIPTEPDTEDVNRMVQDSIGRTFPNSVWQYYRLVNVQWALARAIDPKTPLVGPVRMPRTLPNLPVSNTTMETYRQTTTCTTCHAAATLAEPSNVSADFSFVFQAAGR